MDAITRRQTTRAAYRAQPIPAEVEREIGQAVAREGAWLAPVHAGEPGLLGDLIAEGDRAQMQDKRFRRELASWVHHNRSRAAHGTRGYGFGIGNLMSLAGPVVIRTRPGAIAGDCTAGVAAVARHAAAPTSAPIAEVTAIAVTPQARTRSVARHLIAPPSPAPT